METTHPGPFGLPVQKVVTEELRHVNGAARTLRPFTEDKTAQTLVPTKK